MTIGRQENFDIYTYPNDAAVRQRHERIVLGDLHSNFLKLLSFLIKQNVIASPWEDLEYQELVDIYKKCFNQRMSNRDAQCLLAKLSHFETTEFTSKTSLLVIGDDLADRGGSDAPILMTYSRLAQLNIDYSILASNHGLDFLYQYFSQGGLFGPVVSEYLRAQGGSGFPPNYFGRSLKGLRDYIDGIDEEQAAMTEQQDGVNPFGKAEVLADVKNIVENNYITHLKLLAYDFEEDAIILYSHAPKHPAEIMQLYDELKYALYDMDKDFDAETPEQFAASIDQMNAWFQEVLKRPELFNSLMMHGKPLKTFINTRYEFLAEFDDLPDEEIFGNYFITNVHGHVGTREGYQGSIANWQFVNLDNQLGQMLPNGEHNNRGVLKTFSAEVNTLESINQKSARVDHVTTGTGSNKDELTIAGSNSDTGDEKATNAAPKVADEFSAYKSQNSEDLLSLKGQKQSLWNADKAKDNDIDKDIPPDQIPKP